jgi:phenylacetate-coenzyme A ligase PaaK-like adenylate-forming protein
MPILERLKDVLRALWIARELESHDFWMAGQLAKYQHRRFEELVKHAVTQSPFYQELYRDHLDDGFRLQDLPLTNKRMLMDNFDRVVTDRRLKLECVQKHLRTVGGDDLYLGQYRVVATAGTSGLRGIFVYDRAAWRMVLANTMRWARFVGITPRWPQRLRICTIGADNPVHVSQRIPESGNVGLFKILHLEVTQPLSNLVASLNAFQPDVLMPYPSVASLLAEEQLAGRLQIQPRVVTTHSEVLTEEMAERISTAWSVSPFDHYGLTEKPHVGCECTERRGIHVFEDACIVEVVDKENRPVEPGKLGHKCLLTNLYNGTQPLIRYEISDMLVKDAERCPCGRPFPLLMQIGGRHEDMLILKDGQGKEVVIPPLALGVRVESLPEVLEYHIRHSPEYIHLQVVPRSGADIAKLRSMLLDKIQSAVFALGAKSPPIEVEIVSQLERRRDHMGKIQLVTSLPGGLLDGTNIGRPSSRHSGGRRQHGPN